MNSYDVLCAMCTAHGGGVGACPPPPTSKILQSQSSEDDSEHVLRKQTEKLYSYEIFTPTFQQSGNFLTKLQLQTGSYNAIYLQAEVSCAFFCMPTTDEDNN